MIPWYRNIIGGPEVTAIFLACSWADIAFGVFILLHGYYLHGDRFSRIRFLAELCAIGGILTGIFYLTCTYYLL